MDEITQLQIEQIRLNNELETMKNMLARLLLSLYKTEELTSEQKTFILNSSRLIYGKIKNLD